MKFKIMAAFAVVTAFFAIAPSAFAAQQHAAASAAAQNNVGQCNGPNHLQASTPSGWLAVMAQEGVTNDAATIATSYGYQPRDSNFATWVLNRTIVVHLQSSVTAMDYMCPGNSHKMVRWKPTTHGKGWLAGVILPNNLKPSDVRQTPARGFKARRVGVTIFYQPSCGNVWIKVHVTLVLYVRVTAKATPPKKVKTPTTSPGNCNAIGSPGANVCSTVTYVNVCGTQVVYNGSQSDMQTWINNYIADHCAPTVTTGVCSQSGALNFGLVGTCVFPPSTPTPPPVQTCQTPGATNIGGSLPCQFPPPKAAPSCYINMVQEVDESNSPAAPGTTSTTPVYLYCTAPSGDSLTITLHAGAGTLNSNSASAKASGSNQLVATPTYTAPTEPLTDTVTAHVVDNTTGLSTDASVSIQVVAPVASP